MKYLILLLLLPSALSQNSTTTQEFIDPPCFDSAYMEYGTDSSCSVLDDTYMETDPHSGGFQFGDSPCYENEYLHLGLDGTESCELCNIETFRAVYFKKSLSPGKEHGACCGNIHHNVCVAMMKQYKDACFTGNSCNFDMTYEYEDDSDASGATDSGTVIRRRRVITRL